jgi:hypothetical protein
VCCLFVTTFAAIDRLLALDKAHVADAAQENPTAHSAPALELALCCCSALFAGAGCCKALPVTRAYTKSPQCMAGPPLVACSIRQVAGVAWLAAGWCIALCWAWLGFCACFGCTHRGRSLCFAAVGMCGASRLVQVHFAPVLHTQTEKNHQGLF